MILEFHITSTSVARYKVPDANFEAIADTGTVDMNDPDAVADYIAAHLGDDGLPTQEELLRDYTNDSGIEQIDMQGVEGDVPARFQET